MPILQDPHRREHGQQSMARPQDEPPILLQQRIQLLLQILRLLARELHRALSVWKREQLHAANERRPAIDISPNGKVRRHGLEARCQAPVELGAERTIYLVRVGVWTSNLASP